MAAADCSREISEAVQKRLSKEEINQIIDELNKRANRQLFGSRKGQSSRDEAFKKAASDYTAEAEEGISVAKYQTLLNAIKKQEILDYVDRIGDPKRAMLSALVGVEKQIEEGRLSVDATAKGTFGWYFGEAVSAMDREGLLPLINKTFRGETDKLFEMKVAAEMRAISSGEAQQTGSKQARRLAQIMHDAQEQLRQRANHAGAHITKRWDYIVKQNHNPIKINRVKYEKWKAKILPRLDPEETFKGADVDDVLKNVYDNIIYGRDPLKSKTPTSGFKRPANLANRLSTERTLHFKSAQNWIVTGKRS
jgi:hypothetical protein